MTYGPGYDEAKHLEHEVNELLLLSDTWKDSGVQKIVKVVPRRAPNLKDILFKRKQIALNCSRNEGTVNGHRHKH